MAWVRLLMGILLLAAQPCWASLTWRPGEGWVDDAGDALHASSAKAQLDLARDLESKEAWKDALKAYQVLLRSWPLSIYCGEAQFKVGLMFERRGEFWPAYGAYKKIVSKHPDSQFFDLAIERMFAIGKLHLAGEPQKLWKIPLFPSMNKTSEIFQAVIDAAPYGPYAAPAYFQIGQAREQQKDWSKAISAYNTILDKYPTNDLADDAQYQIGYAWMKASSKADYDQSATEKAIEGFEDFLVRFSESEKVGQAESYIADLRKKMTQGSYNIAKFYETQKNWKAAYIYYNEVVRQAPDSEQARHAKERIEELKPIVEPEEAEAAVEPDETATKAVDQPVTLTEASRLEP